jgi:hypothetical protein
LPSDGEPQPHAGSAVSNEIVAGIVSAVVLHAMILMRVVGPLDSSRDVGADVTAVVAVDDFEVFESDEIVGSVGCLALVEGQLDLGLASVHSSTDPILRDCSQDVAPTMILSSDVALHSCRRVEEQELVVVASGTSGVHFVDSAEIFFAESVADAETEEWSHSLAEESCCSSCSAVAMSMPPASVWDLAGIQSCVDDIYKSKS